MASDTLSSDAAVEGYAAESGLAQSAHLGARQVQCVEILSKDFEGLRVAGWQIQTRKRPILKMNEVERWGFVHPPFAMRCGLDFDVSCSMFNVVASISCNLGLFSQMGEVAGNKPLT